MYYVTIGLVKAPIDDYIVQYEIRHINSTYGWYLRTKVSRVETFFIQDLRNSAKITEKINKNLGKESLKNANVF